MDKKDWILLKTLHQNKNMTRTAEQMFVSQPSLSYRLKNLEEEFGIKLFFKTKHGLEFTSEGEYLVKYSEEMLHQLEMMKDKMSNIGQEVSGMLRLGVSSNFAQYLLPGLLKEFSDEYPLVRFNVKTGWSTEVIELLNNATVHVGIVRSDQGWKGEKRLLRREPLYVISKNELSLDSLPKHRLIRYSTDSSLKDKIGQWWGEWYSEPANAEMEVDRLETCKEMVKNDFGFAIVPEICLHKEDGLYKKELYHKDGKPVTRKTWMIYKEAMKELTVVDRFTDFLDKWNGGD